MNAQPGGISALALGIVIYGYQSTPLTAINPPVALAFAPQPARFEMNCPAASDADSSAEVSRAAALRPRFMGLQPAPFPVGATDCGKRSKLIVECADASDGCFAGDE
jgi:hypothetical protein